MGKEECQKLDKRLLESDVSDTDEGGCREISVPINQKNLKKVLVAGDIMLDIYCFGNVERISPEAPVPVLRRNETKVKYVPGGAANVANNLVAAGIDVNLFAAVGDDQNGEILMQCLSRNHIGTCYVFRAEDRMTTSKMRYIASNNQQLLRVDEEVCRDIEMKYALGAMKQVEKHISDYGMILLSDYDKGFFSEQMTQSLIRLARDNNIPVLVDVKNADYNKYRGATMLKPNREELKALTGMNIITQKQVDEASIWLCNAAACQYVLTTLGAAGMVLVDSERVLKQVSSCAKEVYDVTGAGDTAFAYLAAELLRGSSMIEAMEIANYAAGLQVSKVGTSAVYASEVKNILQSENSCLKNKQLDMYQKDGLKILLEEHQHGKKIVFTNGCFDILHVGHLRYLKAISELGDILVVGVNSDDSVRRLKGEGRPVNGETDRMEMLAAYPFVDYVILFREDTPIELIKLIEPDILAKGADYKKVEDVVGWDFVMEKGGDVVLYDYVEGKSTTNIIDKIQAGMRRG